MEFPKRFLIYNRKFIFLGVIFIALVGVISLALPPLIDWRAIFRPAALEMLSGHSPYNVAGYFNAPWALLPLIPIAVLPEAIGSAILIIVSLGALTYIAHHLGAKLPATLILLLSPPVLLGVKNGNIDWLAALGFILPPQIGLFFIVIKPQIGIAVGFYWLIEAWRKGKLREVIRVFAPVTVAILLSFAVFGLWPLQFKGLPNYWWNTSLWPVSLPVGLALLTSAIRKQKLEYAMAASPLFAPYLILHSWVGALLAIVTLFPEMTAASIGLWGLAIYFGLGG